MRLGSVMRVAGGFHGMVLGSGGITTFYYDICNLLVEFTKCSMIL